MTNDWQTAAEILGKSFCERAARYDEEDRFVAENYAELKQWGFFTMAIPKSLGGGGASFDEVCRVLYTLGRSCPSTALALSMHTHLVAANVWKFHHGKPDGEPMLRKVATAGLVLASTGATDWIDSNGSARPVDGGYRVHGEKRFASGCLGADMLVTSIASDGEPEGPCVLHFALPVSSDGVSLLDDWHTLGMRGTGSHTVVLDDVFVPQSAISLKRPRGTWHPVWSLVLGVAPPIYMSPYMGLADEVADLAIARARRRHARTAASAVGELENARTNARLVWQDMLRLAADYDFEPNVENSSAQLVRKTLLANSVRRVAELAIEVAGGAGFYRANAIERYWRDAQAVAFHPLPERRQIEYTGRSLLGFDVAETPSNELTAVGLAHVRHSEVSGSELTRTDATA